MPLREESSIGSAPKTIKCLSFSEVIACSPTVGTNDAPEVVESLTEDVRLRSKLIEIITRNLTIKQINTIYESKRT